MLGLPVVDRVMLDAIFVVADPGNNDESTLCVQSYEIDLAKPIRLFTISKIE